MMKISVLLTLVFLSNHVISQDIHGEGELTHNAQLLLDKYIVDAEGLDNKESVIICNFRNNDSSNVDTLVIYDDDIEAVYLSEERYSIYKGFYIIMKGFPEQLFFNINFDRDLIKESLEQEREDLEQIKDSIDRGLYNGTVSFVPKNERNKVRYGIVYNGNVILRSEYSPSVYYYIIYYKGKIINRIKSDLVLPNNYYWVR